MSSNPALQQPAKSGEPLRLQAFDVMNYFNHRSADEPIEARQGGGPEGLKATIRWLHRAFADMRFEFHDVAVNDNLVALHVTLHARQHGPFVVHDSPDARVTEVFPSTGRSFAARQTHWITVRMAQWQCTMPFAMTSAWRNNLGGSRPNRSTSCACFSL